MIISAHPSELLRVATFAESLVGTPFRHQGRDPRVGIDCIGLLVVSFAPSLVDVADYPERGSYRLLDEVTKQCGLVARTPGCIVLLARHNIDKPRHAAILLSEGRIVHAVAASKRVEISPLFSSNHAPTSFWLPKSWLKSA